MGDDTRFYQISVTVKRKITVQDIHTVAEIIDVVKDIFFSLLCLYLRRFDGY